jgi:osmotically-inducible protein OsmY
MTPAHSRLAGGLIAERSRAGEYRAGQCNNHCRSIHGYGEAVHHGVVKLSGRVDDGAAKEIAELAARRVKDVSNVVMDVDVTGAGSAAQPSEKIARVA